MTHDLSDDRTTFVLNHLQHLYERGRENLGAIILALGSAFVFAPDAMNIVNQLHHQLRTTARDQLPLNIELDRTRRMVAEVLPQLQQNCDSISVTEADLEELKHQQRTVRHDLDQQK
ncbi:MAG: hypothetical protein WCH39_28850, partial [Schlesneria sp.]